MKTKIQIKRRIFFSSFDAFLNKNNEKETEIENDNNRYFLNQSNNDNEILGIIIKIMNKFLLKTQITKKFRVQYAKLPVSNQKQLNQDEMNLKYLLNLSSIRTYTKKDFQNVDIF